MKVLEKFKVSSLRVYATIMGMMTIPFQSMATEVNLVNWGITVNNTTFGYTTTAEIDATHAGRLEMKQLVIDNKVDFAFYVGSGKDIYFVTTDFGDYVVKTISVANSNYKCTYLFYNAKRWSLKEDEWFVTRTWAQGACLGRVFEDKVTHEQYACVFCWDSFANAASFSTTLSGLINQMSEAYPDARVLVSYNAAKITDLV